MRKPTARSRFGNQRLLFGVALSLASLAGCQQDQAATPRTEPWVENSEEPLVKGDLSSLPELKMAPLARKIEIAGTSPDSRGEAGDRKKLLEKVSSQNESLKKRIQQLESELEKKEQVSRRLDEAIDRLKQGVSR